MLDVHAPHESVHTWKDFFIHLGLKAANLPVELHAYAQGGHAFGLRPSKLPVSGWPQLVEQWLGTIGMIPQ
jgi:hypothetical protein